MSAIANFSNSAPSSSSATNNTISTHEVAATPPDWIIGQKWEGEYEGCTIVNESEKTYDVKITSDGDLCQGILKMYVRPLVRENNGNATNTNSSELKNAAPNSTTTTSMSTSTNPVVLKSDGSKDLRRKGAVPRIQNDYSSSEDLPPSSPRRNTKKGKSSSSSSPRKKSKSTKATPSIIPASCCGRLELEMLGFDHGSSAASSAVGEVSERNIKGGTYDMILPEWRKGQDYILPTNIPVRILTDFAIYQNDGTAIRLEKLPQVDDAYGCYVGTKRVNFNRSEMTSSSNNNNNKVIVSEHGQKIIEDEKEEEKKEIDDNLKQIQLTKDAMKNIKFVPNVLVFGTVIEALPPDLRPRPTPRPLSRWQRSSAATQGRSRRGTRSIKMKNVISQFSIEEREEAIKNAVAFAGKVKIPMKSKGITVESVGKIHTISSNFHSTTTIFPVGFRSKRMHIDIDDIKSKKKCQYVSEIVIDPDSRPDGIVIGDGSTDTGRWSKDDAPLFRVSKIYKNNPSKREW
jgi:hypothetical protein